MLGAPWAILSPNSFLYSSPWKTIYSPGFNSHVPDHDGTDGTLASALTVAKTGIPILPLTMKKAGPKNNDSQTQNTKQGRPVMEGKLIKQAPQLPQVTVLLGKIFQSTQREPVGLL